MKFAVISIELNSELSLAITKNTKLIKAINALEEMLMDMIILSLLL